MAAKIVSGTGIVAVCDVSLSRSSLRCYHWRHACIELYTTTEHFSIMLAGQWEDFVVFLIFNVVTSSLLVTDLTMPAIEIETTGIM
jgi:hypothetical protein